MTNTLDYYNQNAQIFTKNTISVDFRQTQERFLSRLGPGAHILDFGCGSGRDTKYFMSQGYHVDAIDGSEEICKVASLYTGIKVKHMLFQDFSAHEKYDGIWACASILHLKCDEIAEVLHRMADALLDGGIIYTSFKYGEFEGERNDRYFTDMTEDKFGLVLEKISGLHSVDMWLSVDVRPERGDERWLNLILQKSTK